MARSCCGTWNCIGKCAARMEELPEMKLSACRHRDTGQTECSGAAVANNAHGAWCLAVLCCVQAQRASLQKKLEERQADLEAKKAALAAVRAGAHARSGRGGCMRLCVPVPGWLGAQHLAVSGWPRDPKGGA
jgi:hypothetical protein